MGTVSTLHLPETGKKHRETAKFILQMLEGTTDVAVCCCYPDGSIQYTFNQPLQNKDALRSSIIQCLAEIDLENNAS